MSYSIWLCSKRIIFFSTSQIFHFRNKVCEKREKCFFLSHCVLPSLALENILNTILKISCTLAIIISLIKNPPDKPSIPDVLLFFKFIMAETLKGYVLVAYQFTNQKSTAVDKAVACASVTQRGRVRSPVGTSFLGEVFSGFFLTCKANVGTLQAPMISEHHLVIIIIINHHSLRTPMT